MTKKKQMSTLGYVLSAIGAAVGLGNIWRFPTHLMNYGGPAFLLPYLLAVLCLGLPLLILEINLGHKWRKAPCLFYSQYLGSHGRSFAWLQAAVQLLLGCYYAIIIAWIIISAFNIIGIGGTLSGKPGNMLESTYFNEIQGLPIVNGWSGNIQWKILLVFSVVIGGSIFIVSRGLTSGIEKVNKVMVPLLFIIICFFFIYSLTFDNAWVGIYAIFQPNFAKLMQGEAWSAAFGQALFTLSLCVTIIIIYSANAPEKGDNTNRALTIMAGDTLVGLLACVIVGSTIGYGLGVDPETGAARQFESILVMKNENQEVIQSIVRQTGYVTDWNVSASLIEWQGIGYVAKNGVDPTSMASLEKFNGGADLIFRTMPFTFYNVAGGANANSGIANVLGFLFYIAVFCAALSSMISLLEPTVTNLIQSYQISRFKAVLIAGGIQFAFGWWFSIAGWSDVWNMNDSYYTNNLLLIGGIIEIGMLSWSWKKLKPILDHNNKSSMFQLKRWFQVVLWFGWGLTIGVFVFGITVQIIDFVKYWQSIQILIRNANTNLLRQKLIYPLAKTIVSILSYFLPFVFLVVGFGKIWKPKLLKEKTMTLK